MPTARPTAMEGDHPKANRLEDHNMQAMVMSDPSQACARLSSLVAFASNYAASMLSRSRPKLQPREANHLSYHQSKSLSRSYKSILPTSLTNFWSVWQEITSLRHLMRIWVRNWWKLWLSAPKLTQPTLLTIFMEVQNKPKVASIDYATYSTIVTMSQSDFNSMVRVEDKLRVLFNWTEAQSKPNAAFRLNAAKAEARPRPFVSC